MKKTQLPIVLLYATLILVACHNPNIPRVSLSSPSNNNDDIQIAEPFMRTEETQAPANSDETNPYLPDSENTLEYLELPESDYQVYHEITDKEEISEYKMSDNQQIYINNVGEKEIISILPPREEMIIPDSPDDDHSKYFPNEIKEPRLWGSATLYYPDGECVWGLDKYIKYDYIVESERDIELIPKKWRNEVEKTWQWEKEDGFETKFFMFGNYPLILPYSLPVYSRDSDFYAKLEVAPRFSYTKYDRLICYYFLSENNILEPLFDDSFFYIKDGIIYGYDNDRDRNRIFTGICIDDGEEIYRYAELGGMLGTDNFYESNIPSVNNSYDLYEYMMGISEVWYRIDWHGDYSNNIISE